MLKSKRIWLNIQLILIDFVVKCLSGNLQEFCCLALVKVGLL